jgi:hypothetical protein
MAFSAARELKIGLLINKTLDVLEKNWATALLFIAVIGAINAGTTYLGQTRTAVSQQLGLAGMTIIIGVIVNYVLISILLKNTGLKQKGEGGHIVPFFGLSIIYTLGVGLGFILVIIPGLIVMARWSVAQPLFISRGGGVMQSLGQSWEQTRGNEFPIIVAGLAMTLIFFAISIGAPFMLGEESLLGLAVSQVAGAVSTVIFSALGVVLYGLIVAAKEVSETFD